MSRPADLNPYYYFNQGLVMAAKQLTGTAEDLDQSVKRLDAQTTRTSVEMNNRRLCVDKAALLRGQACIILKLQPITPY